jgi:hypothetical protein
MVFYTIAEDISNMKKQSIFKISLLRSGQNLQIFGIEFLTFKLSGKKSGNHTKLTQKQIVVLLSRMLELDYVGNGMTKDNFARIHSEMTGFLSDKLRQDLSQK